MSSIFVANNIILLAELIGQGSIGRATGQADSFRAPSAGSQGELLQRSVALIDCIFPSYSNPYFLLFWRK